MALSAQAGLAGINALDSRTEEASASSNPARPCMPVQSSPHRPVRQPASQAIIKQPGQLHPPPSILHSTPSSTPPSRHHPSLLSARVHCTQDFRSPSPPPHPRPPADPSIALSPSTRLSRTATAAAAASRLSPQRIAHSALSTPHLGPHPSSRRTAPHRVPLPSSASPPTTIRDPSPHASPIPPTVA